LGGCSGARDAGQAGSSAGVPRKLSTQLVRDPEARDGDRIFAVAFGCESLLEIDPTTRKVRSIGHIGFKFGGIEDVALDPAGKPIVVYWEGYPALLRINLETGVATLGPKIHGVRLFERSTIEAIAAVDGVLYGTASDEKSYCPDCADRLVKIDPENGNATVVGKFGPKFLNMEAMAYSPKFGLIGADIGTLVGPEFQKFNTYPSLAKIDPLTARATKIGDLPPATTELVDNPMNARLSPKGPFICGLTFGPDDSLYAATIPTHFGGLSDLWLVDPTNAAVRPLGPMNATNVDGILYVRPAASH
jgi:hypothetical protein